MNTKPTTRTTIAVVSMALVFGCATTAIGQQAMVDFDLLPVGTTYGGYAGDTPGDVVIAQDGIDVSVEEWLGSFNYAEVTAPHPYVFPTNSLFVSALNMKFHFEKLGLPIATVTLEYINADGPCTLAANGGADVEWWEPADFPLDLGSGVAAYMDGDSGTGMLTIVGDLDNVSIGGPELYIDTLVATVPEPATLALVALGAVVLGHRQARGSGR